MKKYLGLEIGGTKTSVWMGQRDDRGLTLTDHILFPTPRDPETCIAEMKKAGDTLTEKAGGGLAAVGISCGSPLDAERGIVQTPPNLPLWQDVPIADMIASHWNVPAFLQNDADACALAEWKYGAGRGTRNMIFLTYGTGFGSGLILDGRLYSGTIGMGGEIGHVRLSESGPVGYGKRGSAEGFCSGGGLKQLADTYVRESAQIGCNPEWAKTDFSAKDVAEAAYAGDSVALAVWKEAGYWLGRACAILVDLLNPQRIVIGSIFARSGSLLIPTMEETLRAECIPANLAVCSIVPCELGEEMGGYGCMAVAETRLAANR